MFYVLLKKTQNIFILFYLLKLRSHNLNDEDKIKKIQNKKVKKIMKTAYKIPLYRKKFDEVGLTPKDFNVAEDLLKFPVLTKAEIREWILPTIKKNPKKYKNWTEVTTSGSTGTPLSIYVSPKENAMLAANWLRIGMCNGYNLFCDKTLALKDPEIIKRRNGKDSIIQKIGIAKRNCISFLSDGQSILEYWNKVKPDYVYIHRSKLVQTLLYAKKNGIALHKPKLCAVIGEGIDANSRDLIFEYLGDVLFSSYGTMETGACTFTKKGTIDKHIVTRDTHVINIHQKDSDGFGKMVITNLFFKGFPIINYDINDGAKYIVEDNHIYLCNISGRMNDMLYFSDGSTVDYHSFYSVMERRKDIFQFRIIQESYEKIIIQLVKNGGNEVDKVSVEKEILCDIEKIIPGKICYKFEWLNEIEPDANGKRRFIISKLRRR